MKALRPILLVVPLLGAGPAPAGGDASSAAAVAATAPGEPGDGSLDYTTLSHVLNIDSLRAGSHDESGNNDYHFTVTMYALLNSAEERNLDFAKRKKVTAEVGTFGQTKIESLAIWRPDEKLKNYKDIKVDGNAIRELAAKAMQQLTVKEGDVAVMVEIVMVKKNKKFFFFGTDAEVAKTSYYPIPATKFDTPLRTNQSLAITDDKGTSVKISVRYDHPSNSAKSGK